MANLVHWGFKRRNKPECWTKVFLNLGTISEVHLRGLFVVRLACDRSCLIKVGDRSIRDRR